LPVESPVTQNVKLKQIAALETQTFLCQYRLIDCFTAQVAVCLFFVSRLTLFLFHSIVTIHVIWHPSEKWMFWRGT